MSLKDDIIDYLAGKTAVTNIITTDVNRLRQGWTPQGGICPRITINVLEYNHAHDLGGGAGYAEPDVEIHLWCWKESERDSLGDAVRGVLQGYSGTMGDTVVRGVTLPIDNFIDEPWRDGSQRIMHHRIMQFQFSIVETIPTYA